jgi:probable F420-dependent oxidoreductase
MAIGIGVIQGLVDLESGDPAVIAKRAEELGFASYWAPEHTVMPVGSADSYPGKQEGEDPPEALYRMPDPLIALSRASAVTTKIRLGTGVCLIPERNPLLTAKEVATLDHLSKGRFVFGIGAGWNEPECTVMGGDFAHRWSQTKESILAMKELWKGEGEFHGNYYDFGPVVCKPVPAQRPHPPILLGSLANPRVFKRVVEWGDGWIPFTTDLAEVAGGRATLSKFAADAGRDPSDIDVTVFSPPGCFRKASDVAEVEKAGADNVLLWLMGADEASLLSELEDLAGEVF